MRSIFEKRGLKLKSFKVSKDVGAHLEYKIWLFLHVQFCKEIFIKKNKTNQANWIGND